MRIALDTNILVYAEGLNDAARKGTAVKLLRRLPPENVHLPVQAVAELFHVMVTKARVARADAKNAVLRWCDQYSLVDNSEAVLLSAMELSSQHQLRTWDAIIMAGAAFAGGRLLLFQDLHEGLSLDRVDRAEPFAPEAKPVLADM